MQKQYDQARELLGALGKVRGGAPESHYGFGVLAWAENRLDVAETEWRETIRLSPGMARAHHNLGILYREKGDRARALSALQDAVRLDPESPLYRLNLGWLQVDMGNRVDGMANLDRARSQTERPDLANMALAVQMLLHNHPEQAEKAAARALEANPDLTLALVLRARALEALKRLPEARALYEQALEQDATVGEARRALERLPAPTAPSEPEVPGTAPEAPSEPEVRSSPETPGTTPESALRAGSLRAFLRLRTLGLLALLVWGLACAGPSQQSAPLRLEFWTIQLRPRFDDYMNRVIAAFEDANPGIHVDWIDLPQKSILQKLMACIAGGVPPDLVNLNTGTALLLE